MRWFAPALASVAVILAVFGARGLVRDVATDASPAPHQAVLGISGAHPAPAIAERIPEPIGPTSFALFNAAAFALAGLLVFGAVVRLTDRRALATRTGLRCRRRGPPQLFTV